MDGINFQGMSRMPLTATEEALIPRPPSSASQVATALPSTYTRFGSSHSLVSAPSFHSLNRLPLNTPTRQTQQYSSPASTSPTIPHGEQEYPQNPQDSYYSHSPAVSLRRGSHSQDTPLHQTHQDSWGSRMDSPTPMTESDDSDDEDDGEISRETDSSKERPSKPRTRRHLDHHHHHPRRSADLLRRLKQSTKLTFGGVEEGSHPGSGFPANNNNIHNQYISSHHPHPHRPQYHRSLDLHFQQSQDSPSGSRRTSREYSDEEKAFPLAPLNHPEPRRSRSAWRPSLSLIRQESSIHGQYPSIHGQYPQHDTRPLDNTSALNQLPIPEEGPKRHRTKQKKASKKDKTKKPIKAKKSDKKPKDRPMDILDDQSKNVLTMPNLQQVLEKKTSFPLGYDDFEAFLQSQRAAEYLNFWADVTAHEQLCRTFDVSERRQMRELQLEERAITRDKRRVALLQHADAHHSSDQTDHGQDLNNSNLYLTSRSSLQLPLTDHPSFPAENRRFGLQDSTSAYAPPTRRQTFDHHSSGAYNKLLQGVESSIHGRRSSMDRARTSIDRHTSTTPFSSQHHFGPPSSSTPTSYNQMMRKRGSTDILAGTKASTGENRAGDLRRSTSQQQLSSEPHPNTLDEIAKLTKAVEESIQLSLANSDPGAPPLSVLESGLFRGPSTTFDQDIGPLQAPLAIRRSVDGPKPIVVPQEPKTLLVQSYRTISLKDVQESALQIYRKFLIQLRTASMAAEEAVSSSKRAFSAPGLPRGSVDGVAQRWDGYAEQVIAEWNEKWRDCGPEARRLRRLSGRTGVSERGDGDHDEDFKNEKDQGFGYKESGSEQGLSEEQMAREEAMAKRRSITGFTAFLNRLLRTETTILELPTLTINTTTVEEEAAASDESEDSGDEEEDYDSDIDDDDEEDDEEVEGNIARKDVGVPPRKDSEIELQAVVTTEMPTQSKEAETIGGSTAADSRRSSTSTSHSSCSHTSELKLEHEDMPLSRPVAAGPIRESSLNKRDQTCGIQPEARKETPVASKVAKSGPLTTMLRQERHTSVSSMDTLNPLGSPKVEQSSFLASLKAARGSIIPTKHNKAESGQELDLEKGMNSDSRPLQRLSSASLPSPLHPTYPNSPTSSSPAPSSSAPLPHPSLSEPGNTGSTAGTSFYLPLECRQRIHAQVLEEGRTEAPHLFGPAKGFVVEIVLRDHYYPLFLEHVQQQNLGLSSHHVSIIRKRGMLGTGIALWVLVVTAQVTFVLVGLGGWASPWVWVVGLLGGWAGSVCLATGILGFSPILGLFCQIAEDRHVWRFRKIVDPSIRTLHFRRSVWMLTYCAFWSLVVMVIFSALPVMK